MAGLSVRTAALEAAEAAPTATAPLEPKADTTADRPLASRSTSAGAASSLLATVRRWAMEQHPAKGLPEPVEPEVDDDHFGDHADRAADRYERTVLGR